MRPLSVIPGAPGRTLRCLLPYAPRCTIYTPSLEKAGIVPGTGVEGRSGPDRAERWIKLPGTPGARVEQVASMLAPFGIVVGDRLGVSCMVYRLPGSDCLVKEVGEVLRRPDGTVLVCPRRDASDPEVVALLQAGELGCREVPSEATGWEECAGDGGVWWQHTLLLTVTERDPYWWAYRTAEVPSDAAARETTAIAVGE